MTLWSPISDYTFNQKTAAEGESPWRRFFSEMFLGNPNWLLKKPSPPGNGRAYRILDRS